MPQPGERQSLEWVGALPAGPRQCSPRRLAHLLLTGVIPGSGAELTIGPCWATMPAGPAARRQWCSRDSLGSGIGFCRCLVRLRCCGRGPRYAVLTQTLHQQIRGLLGQTWPPWVTPAGKHPAEAHRFFKGQPEMLPTLLLARPLLDPELQRQADEKAAAPVGDGLCRGAPQDSGKPQVDCEPPQKLLQIVMPPSDKLAQLHPPWLWSRTPSGAGWLEKPRANLRPRLQAPPRETETDCGNARPAGGWRGMSSYFGATSRPFNGLHAVGNLYRPGPDLG